MKITIFIDASAECDGKIEEHRESIIGVLMKLIPGGIHFPADGERAGEDWIVQFESVRVEIANERTIDDEN